MSEEKYVSKKEGWALAVKQKMAWIVLVVSAVLFAFKEVLDLQRTGQDVLTIIMSILVTYMFTIYTSFALRRLGKKAGKENPYYVATMKNLKEAKDAIKPIVYLTPVFCRLKNIEALKEVRTNLLEESGMKYNLWDAGHYDEQHVRSMLDESQIKVLDSIKSIRLTTLTTNRLLSEHHSKQRNDPLYLGKDESRDNRDALIQIVWSKLFIPIAFSYFTVTVALGWSFLWGLIQTSIILLIGIVYYLDGEEFVTTELRNRYINKADLLIEFKSLYENRRDLFVEEEQKVKQIEEEIKAAE